MLLTSVDFRFLTEFEADLLARQLQGMRPRELSVLRKRIEQDTKCLFVDAHTRKLYTSILDLMGEGYTCLRHDLKEDTCYVLE